MTTTETSTKEAALKSLAALIAQEAQLRGAITELEQSLKSDKPGALDIWKRVHAQILEMKTAVNASYKHASNHDRETGVDQGRAEKKAKSEERAARKGKRKDDDKDEPITGGTSDDPDQV